MDIKQDILQKLPYDKPFLFVDELLHIDEEGAKGVFTFDPNMECYRGHFKNHPVTPGVLLIETMAQIGLVCLGIYITQEKQVQHIAFTSSEVEFLQPVYPGETVTVVSRKIYFRFGKLKCAVQLFKANGEEACSGTLSGIILTQ
ncbi:MAG: 3-hydroxyacyl-ACP dehydratase FabZ family protein [Flavobacterium sp.]